MYMNMTSSISNDMDVEWHLSTSSVSKENVPSLTTGSSLHLGLHLGHGQLYAVTASGKPRQALHTLLFATTTSVNTLKQSTTAFHESNHASLILLAKRKDRRCLSRPTQYPVDLFHMVLELAVSRQVFTTFSTLQ
ncbi:hypothetical protein M3J09_004323 [Ascochyta lentis]